MLVDRAKIFVRSGKGGDGHVSFRREKFVPKGGPDGGDGGRGGSVILTASAKVDTLLELTGRHHWHAQDGQPGSAKQCHGADSDDLYIHLPSGTLVYDDLAGQLLGDLDKPGKSLTIAQGGKGGYGNEHFKSAVNRTPRQFTHGRPGEQWTLRLELKLIAEVGLVGLPNSGKSTLLACVSAARPKIGDYPFTTLEPHLGIAQLSGKQEEAQGVPRRLVIADIPGLIEGASAGQGLGHQFLRHIERTHFMVHLLEIEPADGSDPVDNYQTICRELVQYSKALAHKPQIVALSKMDLLPDDAARQAAVGRMQQQLNVIVLAISAASHWGISTLLESCWSHVKEHKHPAAAWAK